MFICYWDIGGGEAEVEPPAFGLPLDKLIRQPDEASVQDRASSECSQSVLDAKVMVGGVTTELQLLADANDKSMDRHFVV